MSQRQDQDQLAKVDGRYVGDQHGEPLSNQQLDQCIRESVDSDVSDATVIEITKRSQKMIYDWFL